MFKKLKSILLFGGVSKREYQLLDDEIAENNRKNLVVFSLVVCIAMVIMLVSSLYDRSLVKNRESYWLCVVVSAVVFIVAKWLSVWWKKLIYPNIYLFVSLLFWFGIYLGTTIDPTHLTVSFPILLFAVPLLFTDRPIRMNLEILGSILLYFMLAVKTQSAEYLGYNASNVLPYGLLSVFVSTYMMRLKVERFFLEQQNRILSESDQLTGMDNRRCYERHLQRLRSDGVTDELKVVALDINGLKDANDNLGHQAGDELIHGAASCIQAAFGAYGHCYRSGGDEFMVIIDNVSPSAEELQQILAAQTAAWKGNLISGVSVAIGVAAADGTGESIDQLVQRADQLMYENKERYYMNSGIERRKR